MASSFKKTLTLITAATCVIGCFWKSTSLLGQNQKQENSALARWRAHDYPGSSYVGSKACAQCHATEAASHSATPMANALALPAACEVLNSRPRLTFRNGSYSYEIGRQDGRNIYTVSDGTNVISEPILYCFGQGKVGQTYVFKHKGLFYETRLSYYQAIQQLSFTTGHPRTEPTSLEEALGRPLSVDEAKTCFACHSTAAVNGSQLQLDRLVAGIACEGCHGPGQKHIAAIRSGGSRDLQIFNPGKMEADSVTQEFCGTCHRSFDDVMLLPIQGGINNIRFQPYRIFNSPGHKGDPRIGCLACHDPHNKLEHEAAFYDSKCLACHLSSRNEVPMKTRSAPACPVSKQQCASCHMPKIEVPEMHSKFTDHWIRIVRPNEPIPN